MLSPEIVAEPHPLARVLVNAALETGLPFDPDPNDFTPGGAGWARLNTRNGKRCSAADVYLAGIVNEDGFDLMTCSLVERILFDGDRASCVVHRVGNRATETRAGAVVLTAGALETPRLLMLSGIGDPAILASLDIPVRVASAGVGQGLQDHPMVQGLNFRAARPLGVKRDNGGGSVVNWSSACAPNRETTEWPNGGPDLHCVPVQGPSATPELIATHGSHVPEADERTFALLIGLMRVRSRGHVRPLTSDPDGLLDIQPNLISDADDRAAIRAGVRSIQSLVRSEPFLEFGAEPLYIGADATDVALDAFLDQAVSTFYHPCGTVAMGGQDAPLDPRLAVRGTRGLWVADASAMPTIPNCNTHAPSVMIGERAAEFVELR